MHKPSAPRLLIVASAAMLLTAALGARGRGRREPPAVMFHGGDRPLRVGRPAAHTGAGQSEDCARCHSEIAREWQQSQHKTSWTDEVFQASFAIEPMPFCVNCHAPLSTARQLPRGTAATDGIACSACHVRDGVILSSGAGRGDAPRMPGAPSPHPVVRDPRFSQSTYCAGCHQFNFPIEAVLGGNLYDSHAPMQDTYGEWQRSAFSQQNVQCQDCHMPWQTNADGTRYRSHRFLGAGDRSLLQQAATVTVTASKDARNLVTVFAQVAAARVGHAFPTGDLFRRVELTVWLGEDAFHAQTIGFAREFSDIYRRIPNGTAAFVRVEIADRRIQPPDPIQTRPVESNTLLFQLAQSAARSAPVIVHWKLEHLLMPSPQAASQGIGVALNRTTVHEGSLTALSPATTAFGTSSGTAPARTQSP